MRQPAATVVVGVVAVQSGPAGSWISVPTAGQAATLPAPSIEKPLAASSASTVTSNLRATSTG